MRLSVMLEQLGGGMLKSMEIFFLTLIFSLPLGLLISFGRMSKNRILRTVTKVYISVMRGTPLMLSLPTPSSTISMKIPHATAKPVRAVRSLLWRSVWSISDMRSNID